MGNFIDFICTLEGWKTRTKNLHWSAYKKNIHKYLDEFLDVISDYQDSIMEDYMGINGKIGPLDIEGTFCPARDFESLINDIILATREFYREIPEELDFVGIKSETENFIHQVFKYKYLFSLCDGKGSYLGSGFVHN